MGRCNKFQSLSSSNFTATTTTKEPATINTADRDNSMAVSSDGLIAQSRSEQWAGARSNKGIVKGRYYYEVSIRDEGLCRVGWSTRQAKLDLGTDKNGFGYGGKILMRICLKIFL